MSKLFSIFITLWLISACNSTGSGQSEPKVQDEIVAIDVAFQNHGYSHFHSQVIGSREGFNEFIQSVTPWDGKEDFLLKLKAYPINYKKSNLLLYRLTETSSSNRLSVKAPRYDAKNNLIIAINREVPEIGDTAMAYYLLAYKVDKNISELIFDDGTQKVIIENIASTNTVPKNCLTWFDGCNNCERLQGEVACTKLACPNSVGDFYCKKWEKE